MMFPYNLKCVHHLSIPFGLLFAMDKPDIIAMDKPNIIANVVGAF